MLNTLIEMLTATQAPKDKVALLQNIVDKSEELKAILVISKYRSMAIHDLQKTKDKLTIRKGSGDIVVGDLKAIIDGTDPIISEGTWDLFVCLSSPKSIGLNSTLINQVLSVSFNPMFLDNAHALFDIPFNGASSKVCICSVCNRSMKSSVKTGICYSCEDSLADYTMNRRGAFELPINTFNFPKLEGGANELPTVFSYADYGCIKEDGVLKFTHQKLHPDTKKVRMNLPFEYLQKRIVVL